MNKFLSHLKILLSFFITGSSLFFHSYGNANTMEMKNIIYYCENKAQNPWVEDAIAACRGSFLPAVLGLLIYIDNNADIKPMLLESFDWDYKNNYYKLKLKENLFFHNGRKVTAKDLEFSLLRHFFTKQKNTGSMILINLKGKDQITHGQTYKSGIVEGVKMLDERTVAITPEKYSPYFLYTLTHFIYSLVPQEELEDDLVTWKKWPIGAGAYKITKEDKNNNAFILSLVDTKEYPKSPREILFEQTRTLEPDITVKDSISANDKKYVKEELLAPLYRRIFEFNYSSKLGKNKDFRKAVALALSKEEISKLTNVPTKHLNEIIPPGSIGRIHVKEKQNLEESKRLFQKIFGKNNKKIYKVPHTEDKSYLGKKYREKIISMFADAGFHIKFCEITKNLWDPFSVDFKNSPLYLVSTAADYFDPISNFTMYRKGSPAINSYPHDKLLENLIDEASEASDRQILNTKLKNISTYFYKNTVILPLFEIPTIAYYKPEKIKSIGVQFGGLIFYLHNLEVK